MLTDIAMAKIARKVQLNRDQTAMLKFRLSNALEVYALVPSVRLPLTHKQHLAAIVRALKYAKGLATALSDRDVRYAYAESFPLEFDCQLTQENIAAVLARGETISARYRELDSNLEALKSVCKGFTSAVEFFESAPHAEWSRPRGKDRKNRANKWLISQVREGWVNDLGRREDFISPAYIFLQMEVRKIAGNPVGDLDAFVRQLRSVHEKVGDRDVRQLSPGKRKPKPRPSKR